MINQFLGWLHQITYARPYYLILVWPLFITAIGLALALILKWCFRPARVRDGKFKLFGRDWSFVALIVLCGLMIWAMAGPQIERLVYVSSSDNLDIIVALDCSVSMAIGDVAPSRHAAMINSVVGFVNSPAVHDGDRLTLFTFCEHSSWRMPLSTDHQEFLDKLSELEQPKDKKYFNRGQLYTYFVPVLNHIPEALDKQDKFFRSSIFGSWSAYPRVVFMFSDGEDNPEVSLVTPLAYLQKRGIKVYTVGIGTSTGGSINIKIPDSQDDNKFEPMIVKSQLATVTLKLIAEKTGGRNYILDNPSSRVQNFLAAAISENRSPTISSMPAGDPQDFWWDVLALPSLIIIIFGLIVFFVL